ncbi:hypothetical protein FQN54_000983 [Arachnomyces sp. PD_36]|nr:hypothetical protein FQN54_000983 [Arachnomyces sp. PD_36]
MSKPAIVIVPGSWHRPQHYHLLTSSLSSSGYETTAVATPSLDSHPPHASWDQDAAAVRAVITQYLDAGRDVVAVGHSFGGVVVSEAVKGLGKKGREERGLEGGVVRLVYVCAMALPEGESHVTQMKPVTDEEEEVMRRKDEMNKKVQGIRIEEVRLFLWAKKVDGSMTLNKDIIGEVFYNGCDEKDIAEAIELLGSYPSGPLAVPVTYTAYREIPSTYLICENDQALHVAFQNRMVAQGEGAFDVERCQEGHSPFMSNPKLVAECVRRAAGERV